MERCTEWWSDQRVPIPGALDPEPQGERRCGSDPGDSVHDGHAWNPPGRLCSPVQTPRMAGSTSEIEPSTTASARSSIGVGSPLTMTIDAPLEAAIGTMSATGYT